jgi:hypothetical protein
MSSRAGQVAGVVSLYFVVSITLVFVNKILMTGGNAIPAPMFVTWFQVCYHPRLLCQSSSSQDDHCLLVLIIVCIHICINLVTWFCC